MESCFHVLHKSSPILNRKTRQLRVWKATASVFVIPNKCISTPCHSKSANGCKWGTAECQEPWPGTSSVTENIAKNSPRKSIFGMARPQQFFFAKTKRNKQNRRYQEMLGWFNPIKQKKLKLELQRSPLQSYIWYLIAWNILIFAGS